MDYLVDLSDNEKNQAYKGKAHLIPKSQVEKLYDCVPEEDTIDALDEKVKVSNKTANKIKERVRLSFNGLEILLSRRNKIDDCTMWNNIQSIMNDEMTKKVVFDFKKEAGCGTDCFNEISAFISKSSLQRMNDKCL